VRRTTQSPYLKVNLRVSKWAHNFPKCATPYIHWASKREHFCSRWKLGINSLIWKAHLNDTLHPWRALDGIIHHWEFWNFCLPPNASFSCQPRSTPIHVDPLDEKTCLFTHTNHYKYSHMFTSFGTFMHNTFSLIFWGSSIIHVQKVPWLLCFLALTFFYNNFNQHWLGRFGKNFGLIFLWCPCLSRPHYLAQKPM